LPYEDEIDENIESTIKNVMTQLKLTNLECLKSLLGIQRNAQKIDGILKEVKAELVWSLVKKLEAELLIDKQEKF